MLGFTTTTWSLIIESKIESKLNVDQLDRHQRTAHRRGFVNSRLGVFAIRAPRTALPQEVVIRRWPELYCWLLRQPSDWARRVAAYMEVLERKLVAEQYLREGTLTVFAGIPFSKHNPYNYPEAKRVLRLALDELRQRRRLMRELGVDPSLKGRPAITGRQSTAVWDFLRLARAKNSQYFTDFPHYTVSIQQERLYAVVTIPNGIRREFRRNLVGSGLDHFETLLADYLQRFQKRLGRVQGIAPWVEVLQRHYPSQSAEPIVDAALRFDLRTALGGEKAATIKTQPQWLEAAFAALESRRSNLQMTLGATFHYDRCPDVHKPTVLDDIAQVWLACKPFVDVVTGRD